MKAVDYLKKNPPHISLKASWQEWCGLVAMFLLLFILPIQAVNWENQTTVTTVKTIAPASQVLGISTDNASKYVVLPLINFRFDTTFQDSGTISFTIGSIAILASLILIIFLIRDFRKREHKYETEN